MDLGNSPIDTPSPDILDTAAHVDNASSANSLSRAVTVAQQNRNKTNSIPPGLGWRFWFAVAVGLFWVVLLGVTTLYTVAVGIPPFEQLSRSEGILGVEKVTPRTGLRTLLHKPDGTVERYSCRDSDGRAHTCFVDLTKQRWLGKPATIWWYPRAINPWQTDRRVVQLIVDGEVIITPEKTARHLESSKSWAIGLMLFMFVVVMFFIVYEYQRAKSRRNHAKEHH